MTEKGRDNDCPSCGKRPASYEFGGSEPKECYWCRTGGFVRSADDLILRARLDAQGYSDEDIQKFLGGAGPAAGKFTRQTPFWRKETR